jgi:hypothetical protein
MLDIEHTKYQLVNIFKNSLPQNREKFMTNKESIVQQPERRKNEYLQDSEGKIITADHPSEKWGEKALHHQRLNSLFTAVIAIGIALLVAAKAYEVFGQTTAIPVSVTVISNTKTEFSYQQTQLTITNADVARGYLDAPSALRFSVNTNSRTGYIMDFYPIGHTFSSVQIKGLGDSVQLGADGGTIVQRGMIAKKIAYELGFRFTLDPAIHAGNYPWPLKIAVRSLS